MPDDKTGIITVDSIRSMRIELDGVKIGLKAQKAIIDRYAGAKEGSQSYFKGLQAVGRAQRLQGIADELEEALRDSERSLNAVLDSWYPPGTWQNRAAKLAALTSNDYKTIAAQIGERPSHVRSLVADVRRRLMR